MKFNQTPPTTIRCVGLYLSDGSMCRAHWSAGKWRSVERTAFGSKKIRPIGWLEMRDAVALAKARRAQHEEKAA